MSILYTGLTPPKDPYYVHCPFIRIAPKPIDSPEVQSLAMAMEKATHLLFTSKTAVDLFFTLPFGAKYLSLPCYAVGETTGAILKLRGAKTVQMAKEETAEGLTELLKGESLKSPFFVWPHSSLSRKVIPDFLDENKWRYHDAILYETLPRTPDPLPPLEQFEEIVFTSPSTVDSFFHAYGHFPVGLLLTPIGPITAKRLYDLQRTPSICEYK